MTLSVLELFAGAGGAALGLEAAGLHHVGLVELDADACSTLRAAGLGPVIEADARDLATVAAQMSGAPDVLWSSFPCQAWSTAGSRKGAQDERNGWPWTVAALDRFEPSWFLGENVKGLLQHRGGCTARGGQGQLFGGRPELTCPGCYMERVIMPDLRKRFAHAGYWLLDAADYGVPQHRRRVILWAGPKPLQQPAPTHGPNGAHSWVPMGQALGLSNKRCIGGGRNPAKDKTDRRYRDLTYEPSTTVAAVQIGNAGPWVVGNLRGRAGGARMETHSIDEPSRTLRHGGGSSVPYLCGPAPTVTTTEVKGTRASAGNGWTFRGGPDRASDALWQSTGRRRLTVEECATLQDFPDGYPFQGTKTAQYRQVGNAVPPTLARVVGLSLVAAFTDNQRRGNP